MLTAEIRTHILRAEQHAKTAVGWAGVGDKERSDAAMMLLRMALGKVLTGIGQPTTEVQRFIDGGGK